MRRIAVTAALGAALAVAAGARGAPAPTLRLAASTVTWGALDPQAGATFDSTAWSLLHATCTTLVTYRDRSFVAGDVVQPDGAVAFPRVSRDGRVYRFTIRPDLRFSDGTPVTAANYAAAIGRLVDPLMHSDTAFEAADIVSAHGHGRTLTIRLRRPDGGLLDRLALPPFCPIPLNYPIDPDGITLDLGSGPYHVASAVPFRSVVLLPNRYYRGRRQRHFAAITLTIGGTPESLAQAVAAGQYDYSYDGVPPSLGDAFLRRYRIGPHGLLAYKPFAGEVFLPINASSPLFKDNLPLRRAVEYAIDRAEVVRQLAPFNGRRLAQLIPPSFPGHGENDYPLAGANLKLARRLAHGHLRDGNLVFYTIAAPSFVRVANIIAYNLEQLGLRVDVEPFQAQVEQAKLVKPGERWDIGTSIWFADNPDPANFVTPLVGPSGPAAIHDPEFVARLRAASRLTGPARERRFAALAQSAVRDEAELVPLYSFTNLGIVAPRISCVSYNTMWDLNLSGACLKPD
jgi:ABC-type transport system substrate-binding protein